MSSYEHLENKPCGNTVIIQNLNASSETILPNFTYVTSVQRENELKLQFNSEIQKFRTKVRVGYQGVMSSDQVQLDDLWHSSVQLGMLSMVA
jgi:hypothetical protein